MTKTEMNKLLGELRQQAALIKQVHKPVPRWMQDQGAVPTSPETIARVTRDALNTIDGISAQLREGLSS